VKIQAEPKHGNMYRFMHMKTNVILLRVKFMLSLWSFLDAAPYQPTRDISERKKGKKKKRKEKKIWFKFSPNSQLPNSQTPPRPIDDSAFEFRGRSPAPSSEVYSLYDAIYGPFSRITCILSPSQYDLRKSSIREPLTLCPSLARAQHFTNPESSMIPY
jgi:hypothetical protein